MINEQEQDNKCGLFFWTNEGGISLPLKAVECKFSVVGGIADVAMSQHFVHENAELGAINCIYTFPLAGAAAVHECEMRINERIVHARAMEEPDAYDVLEKASAAGHRTLQIEPVRDNLFILSLDNLQPGDEIVVALRYFHTVEGFGSERCMRIPFTPGVRYVPASHLAEAERVSPPRIDRSDSAAAQLRLSGTLNLDQELGRTPFSPTHPVSINPADRSTLRVELDGSREFPDRDFVLRWNISCTEQPAPRAWSDGEFSLLEIAAPESVPDVEDFSQDIYFLLDRSFSMQGEKWHQAANALTEFLQVLGGSDDRIGVTLYSSNWEDLRPDLASAKELLNEPAVIGLADREVDGGTELLPALRHVFRLIERHSEPEGRSAAIVLITDGQVCNEAEVIGLCGAKPSVRVHCLGIDTAVNDAFLSALAQQQGGLCRLQTPAEEIGRTVAALGRSLRRPSVLDVRVVGDCEHAGDQVGDLFAGQVISFPLCRSRDGAIQLTGRLADGREWCAEIEPTEISAPAIRLLWQRMMINQLLSTGQQKAAIELAIENNLLCDGVVFAAVDAEETGETAGVELHQPSMNATQIDFECSPEAQSEEHCDLKNLFDIGIDELELSDEITRLLTDGEVSKLGFLAAKTRADLKSIGLTEADINEVEQRLCEFGLVLGMQFDPSLFAPKPGDHDDVAQPTGLDALIVQNLADF